MERQQKQQQKDLGRQVADKDRTLRKLKDLIAFSQHRYDTMMDQEAMEHDLEVQEVVRKNDSELEAQRHIEYKLKKEQDTLQRGLDMMEKEHNQISKAQEEAKIEVSKLKAEAEAMQ